MSAVEFGLLATASLFSIINPIAAVPGFLAMTSRDEIWQRRRMAGVASLTCAFVLAFFAACGSGVFRLFGITIMAFQIAGGLVLLLSSLDMLRAKRSALKETQEEMEAGSHKDDIAITPLAIPMLSGPGAITTAIVLFQHAHGAGHIVLFFACIAGVSAATYLILYFSAGSARALSPIAMNIITRLMGLLLAALGVQFILSALKIGI